MKNLIFLFILTFSLISCYKQEPIPQSALTGIWKLNGYASSNYKVEITNNGYLYWFNYNDIYNKVQEFEVEYDINRNTLKLYCGNSRYAQHTLKIYQSRNGRLSFTNPVTGLDANGETIINYDTYYLMD
ncbi:MAG TPA: hypothetical protein PKC41_06730 [Chitinophagaceae bacterium]|jgi:hypothetical protein|nr:hypothetical protein [Chitinophagaceae bacterium]